MAKIRIDKNENFFKRPLEYWSNRYHLIHTLNEKCAVCGCGENLETHHITPESNGGSHEIENLIVLCKEHHRGKKGVHGSRHRDMTDSHHVIKLLRTHIEA
ncbi:MAG: HNH endonuclease [Bacillota bacterium]